MKINKWRFYLIFTLAAAMVIATIITNTLYLNGLDKIIIFAFGSILILGFLFLVINSVNIACIIVLLIFCSSSFLIFGKSGEYIVVYQRNQAPMVLEYNIKLAVPYTYDIAAFDHSQRLVIIDKEQSVTVDFELLRENVLMIQHGFADQKDFAAAIQKKADLRFFRMNDLEKKAYLDSFDVYGLRWKKVIIEREIENNK